MPQSPRWMGRRALASNLEPNHAPANPAMVSTITGVAIKPLSGMLGGDPDERRGVGRPRDGHIAAGDPPEKLILRLWGELDKGGAYDSQCLCVKRIKRLPIHLKKVL